MPTVHGLRSSARNSPPKVSAAVTARPLAATQYQGPVLLGMDNRGAATVVASCVIHH